MRIRQANTVVIDDSVPRRRRAVLSPLGRLVLRLCGWRLNIRLQGMPKAVIIAAPHTSNWDSVFGLAAICAAELDVRFYAKHTAFVGPLGWLLRWLGGIPINRSVSGGTVEHARENFAGREQLLLAMAPEGTRKRVAHWKSGFHRIARAAKVPIAVAYIDYGRRECGIAAVLTANDDYAQDMSRIMAYYRDVTPRHPDQFAGG